MVLPGQPADGGSLSGLGGQQQQVLIKDRLQAVPTQTQSLLEMQNKETRKDLRDMLEYQIRMNEVKKQMDYTN